jgi:hypothetical protein
MPEFILRMFFAMVEEVLIAVLKGRLPWI